MSYRNALLSAVIIMLMVTVALMGFVLDEYEDIVSYWKNNATVSTDAAWHWFNIAKQNNYQDMDICWFQILNVNETVIQNIRLFNISLPTFFGNGESYHHRGECERLKDMCDVMPVCKWQNNDTMSCRCFTDDLGFWKEDLQVISYTRFTDGLTLGGIDE